MDIYTLQILPNYFHGRLLKLAHLHPHYPLDIGYDLPGGIAVREDNTDLSPAIILHADTKKCTKHNDDNGSKDGLWGLLTPPTQD